MLLDENSLLAVGAITSLVTAAIFFGLARTSLAVPGLRFWGASFLCMAIGLGSNRVPLADWRIASIAFNLPLGFADLFLLIGALHFLRRQQPRAVLVALGAWTVLVTLAFTLVWPLAGWRMALLAGHGAVVRGWTGMVFWSARADTGRAWYRLVGVVLLLESLAAAAQALIAATAHGSLSYALPEIPWANAIAWGGLIFGSVLAGQMLLLLIALRLIGDMREMANRDPLTGCLNRRGLRVSMEPLLALAGSHNAATAVLMIDIDHFKQVNDRFGHAVGDRVLELLGGVLREGAVPGALAARWGGEEFVSVLPGVELTAAVAEAERLRSRFAQCTGALRELPGGCTLSVGIGYGPFVEAGLDALQKTADEALYAAKREGRDRVEVRKQKGTETIMRR